MPNHQFPSCPSQCDKSTERAAWNAIHGLIRQVNTQQLPDAVKRATALALALLEGGEHATAEEVRAVARERDEPLGAAEARAIRARAERVLAEQFGGPGSLPGSVPETHGFGLATPEGEITAVVFSEGDALRVSRATNHRITPVLVREVPRAGAPARAA